MHAGPIVEIEADLIQTGMRQCEFPVLPYFVVQMNLLSRLFQRAAPEGKPLVSSLGRFSDANKAADQYRHFDHAHQAFELGNYREAIISFLHYLKNSEGDNVIFSDIKRHVNFSLIQGSRQISGLIKDDRIIARSLLVQGKSFSTSLLRKLLEKNYELNYCRYALDNEGQLHVVFESFVQDANPYKLYFGLKELAIQADKMDDLILMEFPNLTAKDVGHIRPVDKNLIDVKSSYFYSTLRFLENRLESGDLRKVKDPTVLICAILGTFYKLDYILTPHGQATELIEQSHKEYFADNTQPVEVKVANLRHKLRELSSVSADELRQEWYEVIYTFGINSPVDLFQVQNFIRSEWNKIDWYIENNQFDAAQAAIEFVIGYSFFNYSIDQLLKSILTLYYRVSDFQFFAKTFPGHGLVNSSGGINKKKVLASCKTIIDEHEDQYHNINIPIDILNFSSVYHFGHSLLKLVLSSSFVEVEGK